MNLLNYITGKYKELEELEINIEYIDLYAWAETKKLQEIFSTLHYYVIELYKSMNSRLPTGEYTAHYWAEPSRQLITVLGIISSMEAKLKKSKFEFITDEYYKGIFNKSKKFLQTSGGSEIPPHMQKVELYYEIPIFTSVNTVEIQDGVNSQYHLKPIGAGSYADVYKYFDENYEKNFVIKRAKKTLNEKELERFKLEFTQLKKLNSPYIVEVYKYNDKNNEYSMEYMDFSIQTFIDKNNTIPFKIRKSIVKQVLRAFQYIHSKQLLHRDISPANILLKKYDDNTLVVKVCDFGLVKIKESSLTSLNTDVKGAFNDIQHLNVEGFGSYNMVHETYALTNLILFIFTGKIKLDKIKDVQLTQFRDKGLSDNKDTRFQNIQEMIAYVDQITEK